MEMSPFFKNFGQINLAEINVVPLANLVRSHTKCDLRQSLNMARMIKEAHRLGVIRGQAVNTK